MEGGVGSGKEFERMEENGGRPCLLVRCCPTVTRP